LPVKKVVFVVALACLGTYLGWRYWQEQSRTEFCEKMRACLSEHDFYDNFGSPEECPSTRRALEGVRLYMELGCEMGMDCKSWLRCGLGESEGREDPFRQKKSSSDFEELLPHVEGRP
jgi:hypothetical protein